MPTHDDRYEQARRQFDELDVEERARFLINASASLLAQGLEQAGEVLADGLKEVLRQTGRPSSSAEPERPGAAEPETAQRQASRES